MPFLISFSLGLALMPIARRAGLALGIVDRPTGDELKIHGEPIPLLGGVATITVAFAAQALWGGWLPWAVLAAAGVALAAGLVDDLVSLPPILRVGLIGIAGAIPVVGNAGLDGLGIAGGAGVILLVLACANAVNITDGQDGLAGGVAAFASLGLSAILWLRGDGMGSSLGLALGGGLVAFLGWNRPPATIFLGDGGAYAVGTLLAILAARAADVGGLPGLLAAGATLGVLAFEVAFSVGRRLGAGVQLTGGDRLHSYDLVAHRWGRTRSTLTFWSLAALCAAGGLLVSELPVAAGASLIGAGILLAAWWGIWLWRRRLLPGRGRTGTEVSGDDPPQPHRGGFR